MEASEDEIIRIPFNYHTTTFSQPHLFVVSNRTSRLPNRSTQLSSSVISPPSVISPSYHTPHTAAMGETYIHLNEPLTPPPSTPPKQSAASLAPLYPDDES